MNFHNISGDFEETKYSPPKHSYFHWPAYHGDRDLSLEKTPYSCNETREQSYLYSRLKKEKIHIIKRKIDAITEVLDKNDIDLINTELDKDDLIDLILFYDAVRWRSSRNSA